MSTRHIVVAGGGAAGFFGAIAAAEAAPGTAVTILEKSPHFLAKVRISGGGRCNVTHACFDPRELAAHYPRGGRALIGPFQRFQPTDTVAWFEAHGIPLKTEADGRMFPTTDNSETIIHCLLESTRAQGVRCFTNRGIQHAERRPEGGFLLHLDKGETMPCDRLLLATGGCSSAALGKLAESLGHTLIPPVPSLFTFQIEIPWLRALAGVSVPEAEVSVPSTPLRERGPLLVTHWGVSGPAILRLSAWGARILHDLNYRFSLVINWLPGLTPAELSASVQAFRTDQGARQVRNTPLPPLTARLWEQLVQAAGIPSNTRWAGLPRPAQEALLRQLTRTEFPVSGKSTHKDEFVTCGGVPLGEVDMKTMASRVCPGLHLAGELLDIDGLTGGFNFQAAWTTGWLAGQAMVKD
jgi:predicted Rossmann fold flavoprotein